ncbi:MAG: ribosome silencing factor, partial [Acidimicrobiales bacterium]
SNERHVRAIAEEVERRVKSEGGGSPRCVEGRDDARWILMDYGDYVVHVFGEEARAYYDLERLWGDAPRLAWDGSTPGHLAAESGPPGDGRRLAGSGAAEDESPVAGNGTGVGREPAGLSS